MATPRPPSTRFVIVLTTAPDTSADDLARTLVTERLAACVNLMPAMQSIYQWQGAVETAAERLLVIKTAADRVDALRARAGALHPYEVPEFLVLDVAGGSDAYLDWVWSETRGVRS